MAMRKGEAVLAASHSAVANHESKPNRRGREEEGGGGWVVSSVRLVLASVEKISREEREEKTHPS